MFCQLSKWKGFAYFKQRFGIYFDTSNDTIAKRQAQITFMITLYLLHIVEDVVKEYK